MISGKRKLIDISQFHLTLLLLASLICIQTVCIAEAQDITFQLDISANNVRAYLNETKQNISFYLKESTSSSFQTINTSRLLPCHGDVKISFFMINYDMDVFFHFSEKDKENSESTFLSDGMVEMSLHFPRSGLWIVGASFCYDINGEDEIRSVQVSNTFNITVGPKNMVQLKDLPELGTTNVEVISYPAQIKSENTSSYYTLTNPISMSKSYYSQNTGEFGYKVWMNMYVNDEIRILQLAKYVTTSGTCNQFLVYHESIEDDKALDNLQSFNGVAGMIFLVQNEAPYYVIQMSTLPLDGSFTDENSVEYSVFCSYYIPYQSDVFGPSISSFYSFQENMEGAYSMFSKSLVNGTDFVYSKFQIQNDIYNNERKWVKTARLVFGYGMIALAIAIIISCIDIAIYLNLPIHSMSEYKEAIENLNDLLNR